VLTAREPRFALQPRLAGDVAEGAANCIDTAGRETQGNLNGGNRGLSCDNGYAAMAR